MIKKSEKLAYQPFLCLLLLFAYSSQCLGAPAEVKGRGKCLLQAEKSPERIKAEEAGGRQGVNEYFIDKCGVRETHRNNHGERVLSTNDCAELYQWASSGACSEDSFANYQHETVKQLDPKVFSLKRYTPACENLLLNKISKDDFRSKVCTEPREPQVSKRLKHE